MRKIIEWLFLTILVCVYTVESCKPDQVSSGVSCYELLAGMTWQNARDACSGMGGVIAIPKTLDEHDLIWKIFTDMITEGNLWIGCEENMMDGRWMQAVGGYECRNLNWYDNQPSAHLNEYCVEMRRGFSGKLNDNNCDSLNHAICEFNATHATKQPHSGTVSPRTTGMLCLETGRDGYLMSPRG